MVCTPTVRTRHRAAAVLVLLLGLGLPGAASALSDPGDPDTPARATRVPDSLEVSIDGRLEDEVWKLARPISDFTQQEPVEGGTPSEPTEIRILFDRDALYIGAEFHDSNPEGIIAHQRRRNAGLGSDDRFMWILDTFLDGRTGYFFEVNPAGLMGDGIILPGSGRSVNKSWDGIWEVRTRIHDEGWTAEIRIPFSTLNFDPDLETWGINFQRTIRRRNEEIVWRGWRRNQALTRPVHAGRIGGIRGISQGLGAQVKPYVAATADEQPALAGGWSGDGKTGMDLTYSITPSLRAALTVNTDFAEVEADQRRVNLSRFPIQFPERRDFFLEGSGVFSFAPTSSPNPFFSRQIGLVEGQEVPIRAGGRVVGQAGRNELGFYQIRTGSATVQVADSAASAPAEDFTVARVKRALFQQSHVGAIYTRRARLAAEDEAPAGHTVGLDADLFTSSFLGRYNAQVEGFFVAHTDPAEGGWDELGDRSAGGVRVNFPNDLVRFHASHRIFGEAYAPAAGFVRRRGFRRTQPTFTFAPRPGRWESVRQLQFSLALEYLTDMDGRLETRNVDLTLVQVEMETGDRVEVEMGRGFERLDRAFTVHRSADGEVRIEPGGYHTSSWGVSVRSAGRRRVSGNVSFGRTGFWSGIRREFSGGLTARPRPGVSVGTNLSRNEVRLPQGDFETNLARFNAEWDPTPLLSFSGSLQYDDVSRVVGLFARTRWIVRPGSDIFLVWTHNWLNENDPLVEERGFRTLSRGAALKVNYTLRL